MSTLENKAVELLDKLESVLTKYTPETAQAVLDTIFVSSIGNIIKGLIALTAFILILYYAIKKWKEYSKDDINGSEYKTNIVFASFFPLLITAFLFIICLFHTWVWVGLFNPKLVIIHRILGF